MYFKRKVDDYLDDWLNKNPVLLVGIRQCGKTEAIREFSRRNNLTLIEMNFWTHPEHYGKTKLIKIGDYNVSEVGDIIAIPHYLIFALGKLKYDF